MNSLKKAGEDLGIKINTYLPEEVYKGDYLNLAPDILFEIDDGECTIHYGFGNPTYQKPPPKEAHTGIHKKDGIFICYGPEVNQGLELPNLSICDVAPTILHMLGQAVPEDMDGRVIKEIFKDRSNLATMSTKCRSSTVSKNRLKNRVRSLKRGGRV